MRNEAEVLFNPIFGSKIAGIRDLVFFPKDPSAQPKKNDYY